MITSLEDFGIKNLSCVLNDIYGTGIIAEEFYHSHNKARSS